MAEDQTQGAAMQQLAELESGPEIVGFVTDYLERSARERDSIQASLYRQMERERDEWREYAHELEAQVGRIQQRFGAMLEINMPISTSSGLLGTFGPE